MWGKYISDFIFGLGKLIIFFKVFSEKTRVHLSVGLSPDDANCHPDMLSCVRVFMRCCGGVFALTLYCTTSVYL